ncbi:hypothetical protein BDZ45DRAFT_743211 [Acephala macrosclerotiorum]|nr:hypothetical protein BDZ45DRAFT_743211 [Acephala macrosclerotiorum]
MKYTGSLANNLIIPWYSAPDSFARYDYIQLLMFMNCFYQPQVLFLGLRSRSHFTSSSGVKLRPDFIGLGLVITLGLDCLFLETPSSDPPMIIVYDQDNVNTLLAQAANCGTNLVAIGSGPNGVHNIEDFVNYESQLYSAGDYCLCHSHINEDNRSDLQQDLHAHISLICISSASKAVHLRINSTPPCGAEFMMIISSLLVPLPLPSPYIPH